MNTKGAESKNIINADTALIKNRDVPTP